MQQPIVWRWFSVAGALAMGLAAGWLVHSAWPAGWRHSAEDQHLGPTIEQVRRLSALVTVRTSTADVQQTTLAGWTGSVRVVILVKGDYLVTVDLAQAKLERVDQQNRRAVLVLPPPQTLDPRVDHERTVLFAVWDTGVWHLLPTGEPERQAIDQAFREAQRAVSTAAGDPMVLEQSRQQAEAVLTTFFDALGWRTEIRWAADPHPRPR